MNFIGLNLKENTPKKELQNIVTVEGLNTMPLVDGNIAFCESNKGFDLEKSCNNLTKTNCNLTSCCIWSSYEKCKAGNKSGPLFNTDTNGKTIPLDYYYFQNKCYGDKCE